MNWFRPKPDYKYIGYQPLWWTEKDKNQRIECRVMFYMSPDNHRKIELGTEVLTEAQFFKTVWANEAIHWLKGGALPRDFHFEPHPLKDMLVRLVDQEMGLPKENIDD